MPRTKLALMLWIPHRAVPGLLILILSLFQGSALLCELSCLAGSAAATAQPASPGCDGDHSANAASDEAGPRSPLPGPDSPDGGCAAHVRAHGGVALAAGKTPAITPTAEHGLSPAASPILEPIASGGSTLAVATDCPSPPPARSLAVLRI